MIPKLLILCFILFFFSSTVTYAEVTMQVGNSTLRSGTPTPSPFMTNENGDNIINLSSHTTGQNDTSQEIAPVIQVYPQVDLNHPKRPRKHSDHRDNHKHK